MATLSARSRETGRKHAKRGVAYNVLVCGTAGLGKSTFVRTLIGRDLSAPQPPIDSPQTFEVIPMTEEMDIFDQKLILTIVDTPGFGDDLDNTKHFRTILDYIEEQYQRFFDEGSRVNRDPKLLDTRVHVVLYFIAPTGHALKEIDVQCMSTLAKRANVIPVVAKADSLTPKELAAFKKRVMEDIRHHGIDIYDFPSSSDDDDDTVADNASLAALLPFAVVGSDMQHTVEGRKVRGRKYHWGIVDVENPAHSDFLKLSEMLFLTHLQVLKEVTDDCHYEAYRAEYLRKVRVVDHMKIEQELQEKEMAGVDKRTRDREDLERKRQERAEQEREETRLRLDALKIAEASANREPSAPTPITPSAPVVEEKKKKEKKLNPDGTERRKKTAKEEGTEAEDKPKKKKDRSVGDLSTPTGDSHASTPVEQ